MDYKEFYNTNAEFQTYVNRYMASYHIPLDAALEHAIVRSVAHHYKEVQNR